MLPVSDLTFFRSRESEMRKAAAESGLSNVRDRCERAAAAFAELADRAERSERNRELDRLRRAETVPAS